MIAQSNFADTDDRIQVDNIVANTAGQCDRRNVVAARVAPCAQTLLTQCTGMCKKRARVPGRVVGTQDTDHAGNAGTGKLAKR